MLNSISMSRQNYSNYSAPTFKSGRIVKQVEIPVKEVAHKRIRKPVEITAEKVTSPEFINAIETVIESVLRVSEGKTPDFRSDIVKSKNLFEAANALASQQKDPKYFPAKNISKSNQSREIFAKSSLKIPEGIYVKNAGQYVEPSYVGLSKSVKELGDSLRSNKGLPDARINFVKAYKTHLDALNKKDSNTAPIQIVEDLAGITGTEHIERILNPSTKVKIHDIFKDAFEDFKKTLTFSKL